MVIADNTEFPVVGREEWVEVGYLWSRIKQSPFLWSLFLNGVAIPSLVRWAVSLSRVALNSTSHNWPKDKRVCCSAGKTSHLRASRGSSGKGSRAVCVVTVVYPFGMCTRFPPWTTVTLLSYGQVAETT